MQWSDVRAGHFLEELRAVCCWSVEMVVGSVRNEREGGGCGG